MESLPNDILAEIFMRMRARNNAALVCRKWYEVDRVLRRELFTGCGFKLPKSTLATLCARFHHLTTIDISYVGWILDMGKQVDNESLRVLSINCTNISDLSLNFCSFITNVGVTNLMHFYQQLRVVWLNFTPCVMGRGLLSLMSNYYFLNRLMNVRVLEWLEFINKNHHIESLAIRNYKGVEEAELARLRFHGWQTLWEFFYEVNIVHRPTGDFYGHNGRGANLLDAWRFPNLS